MQKYNNKSFSNFNKLSLWSLLTICTIIYFIPSYGYSNLQLRIQDFPEEGVQTPQVGPKIRFCQIFPKTAWNWKNLVPRGGGGANIWFCQIFPKTAWNWKNLGPRGASLVPPLRSSTDLKHHIHNSQMFMNIELIKLRKGFMCNLTYNTSFDCSENFPGIFYWDLNPTISTSCSSGKHVTRKLFFDVCGFSMWASVTMSISYYSRSVWTILYHSI